ncbi:hypothetical protein TSUD_227680 [Trifolium subterraneum]|uniref:TF-B3 domain-containing protein n=1 Tax=Trifolium subterraneum TaxID=3900 RepID=A0A2Z6M9T1_TRISU|nr:hypothetical protein TSUD_227680 [Trifolium subterraneum]
MRITTGFRKFARDNNLLKGVIYHFELIKSEPVVVLQVTTAHTKIPDNFITIFGNELNNVAKVTVPDGRYVHCDFAAKYLKLNVPIKLQNAHGEEWEVFCIPNTFGSSEMRITRGFPNFLRANNLSHGDYCVFELIKKEPVVLIVTMFHMVDYRD